MFDEEIVIIWLFKVTLMRSRSRTRTRTRTRTHTRTRTLLFLWEDAYFREEAP